MYESREGVPTHSDSFLGTITERTIFHSRKSTMGLLQRKGKSVHDVYRGLAGEGSDAQRYRSPLRYGFGLCKREDRTNQMGAAVNNLSHVWVSD